MAIRLALQQRFPIQIFLPFPRFKLLPNFIFQCYRPQTWQFYLVCPALSFLVLTKCQVLNLSVCRSCDRVLQRAYCCPCPFLSIPLHCSSSHLLSSHSGLPGNKSELFSQLKININHDSVSFP